MRKLLSASPGPAAGTWATLTNTIPDPRGAQVMLLLSDGTVMVQGGGNDASKAWFRLTPDATGGYANGTWSQMASMGLERLFFPTAVLPSGKVIAVGGEYTGANTTSNFDNSAEIYDPVADSWTNIATFPQPAFGDDPIEVLPDGKVLAGFIGGPQTYIYDPAANNWSQTGSKLRNDRSDEETWVKLPDDSILSYDVFSSTPTVGHAQRYIPSQGTWVDAGTLPLELSNDNVGRELGPAFLLPDGRVLQFGATDARTAFYTPSTNSWAVGPSIPNGLVLADAPGAIMPNGHVLFAASPQGTLGSDGSYTFPPPTTIFEFDPVAGTFTDVTPTTLNQNSFQFTMLVLPTGQVLLSGETPAIGIYTPAGTPNDAWKPTITSVFPNGDGTMTLTGTQLNGISEGASYGDDNEMASNYPIVRLRDQAGNVFYARTFDWSSTGVATGNTPVSVQFTLPAGHPLGQYGVTVIANGIASNEVQADLAGFQVANVAKAEGNSGLTDFVFTVTHSASPNTSTVSFSTADGTAQAPSDYIAQSGTLTFAPGETVKTITIKVVGDVIVEPDETFFLDLGDVGGTGFGSVQAIGKILNDDVDLSVNDVTVTEGDSGTKNAVFTVSAVGAVQSSLTVSYSTLNGTAQGGTDYLPRAGVLVFPPGGGTQNITVPVIGDKLNESTETFQVVLANAIGGRINKGVGIGTILDDDPTPSLYVSDAQVTTTANDVLAAVFTVALDVPSGQPVTVNFATADGTAHAGVNYAAESGVVTFAPGVTTQSVTVPVVTSTQYSPNLKLFLNLTNPLHALFGDSQGVGTIVFAAAPTAQVILDNGDAGYSHTAGWTTVTNTQAYQLDYDYHAQGSGTNTASWTVNGLPAGQYQVFTRWTAFNNRATNAPYTILDGTTPIDTELVNQQLDPTGDLSNGVMWQALATVHIETGTLTVRLSDNANGYVIADAVRIVGGGIGAQKPEMDVAGNNNSIGTSDTSPTAADGTDFGNWTVSNDSDVHTFTILNTGDAALHLSGNPPVVVGGLNPADFQIVAQPAAVVAPGASTTFQVMFHPNDFGLREALISIDNDDDSEHPYVFGVQGIGTEPPVDQFHNAATPLDVNGDSRVSSMDALLVISTLMTQNAAKTAGVFAPQATVWSGYVDVNGDGTVSPMDALLVISYLLNPPKAAGAAAPAAMAMPSAAPATSAAASPSAHVAAVDQAFAGIGQTATSDQAPAASATPASVPASTSAAAPSAAPLLTPITVRAFFASSAKKPAASESDSLLDAGQF